MACQRIVPVTNPDSSEPKAQHIRITPVNGSTSFSVANATTATSMPPKIAPSAAQATMTGTRNRTGSR